MQLLNMEVISFCQRCQLRFLKVVNILSAFTAPEPVAKGLQSDCYHTADPCLDLDAALMPPKAVSPTAY